MHKVLAMDETTSSSSSTHKHSNRLAAEHCPHLLQHARNPSKSIGTHGARKHVEETSPFSCQVFTFSFHPRPLVYARCHVMEVKSFEDEEVAKLLTDSFSPGIVSYL